ncbi:MAG TPA: DUF5947 family protein [Pseudonocardia sp.]|nr:DUF5947 family protein [Pseudonocardia sp.]
MGERCDLCAVELPQPHRHMLDTRSQEIGCVCQACSLLFNLEAASEGHYLLIPRRRVRLPDVSTTRLGVPVGLAYFVPRTGGTVDAHYPSPAGPTRWEVDADAWRDLEASCPPLAGMKPEVEALLVNTTRDRREHWIVPVDDCFALVAVVRREWKGLSGGSTVWPEIDRFFDGLTERRA